MYLGKDNIIKNPNLDNKLIAEVIQETNSHACIKHLPKRISKTTTSTFLGEILQENLEKTKLCQAHDNEKGHPDILPLGVCNKTNYFNNTGFDIKVTCGNNFAAHHNSSKNILGIYWTYICNIPQITSCLYLELNENSWTKVSEIRNTKNTNCCTIKPEILNNSNIIYCIEDLTLVSSKVRKILQNNIEKKNILLNNELVIPQSKKIENYTEILNALKGDF